MPSELLVNYVRKKRGLLDAIDWDCRNLSLNKYADNSKTKIGCEISQMDISVKLTFFMPLCPK
jgi:hypothetical protein